MDKYDSEKIQLEVMKWYGWGSPIGLTVFFVGCGILAVLVRYVITGSF